MNFKGKKKYYLLAGITIAAFLPAIIKKHIDYKKYQDTIDEFRYVKVIDAAVNQEILKFRYLIDYTADSLTACDKELELVEKKLVLIGNSTDIGKRPEISGKLHILHNLIEQKQIGIEDFILQNRLLEEKTKYVSALNDSVLANGKILGNTKLYNLLSKTERAFSAYNLSNNLSLRSSIENNISRAVKMSEKLSRKNRQHLKNLASSYRQVLEQKDRVDRKISELTTFDITRARNALYASYDTFFHEELDKKMFYNKMLAITLAGVILLLIFFLYKIESHHKDLEFLNRNLESIVVERTKETEKLSLVASRTENAVLIANEHSIIEWVNDGFVKTTGYSSSEAVGKNISFLSQHIEGEDTFKKIQKKLGGGQSVNEEIIINHKDGNKVWLSISITPVEQEGIRRFVTIATDITGKKEAEEMMKKMSGMIENSTDIIASASLDGRIQFANQTSLNTLGAGTIEEARKHTIFDYCFPEDVKIVTDEVLPSLMSKGRWEGELSLRHLKTQEPIAMRISAFIIRDRNGNPVEMAAIMRDIRTQRATEDQLRRSEEKWRSLIQNAPDTIVNMSLDGTILFINNNEPETIIGKTAFDFIPPDQHEKLRTAMEEVRKTRGSSVYEVEGIDLQGNHGWYLSRLSPIFQDGELVSFSLIASNISERKKTEEALKKSQGFFENEVTKRTAELREALEIIKKRSDKTIRYQSALLRLAQIDEENISDTFRQITEVSADTLEVARAGIWLYDNNKNEIVCRNIFSREGKKHEEGTVLKAADYPVYFQSIRENLVIAAEDANIHPYTREFSESYLKPFGITSMMDSAIRLHGEIVGIICHEHTGPMREWTPEDQSFASSVADTITIAIETHERKQAEASLQKLYGELEMRVHERTENLEKAKLVAEESLKVKEQFLAHMSHEIRTPMNGIIGITNLLYRSTILSKEQKEYLDAIKSSADNLLVIINNILDISRIEAGKMRIEEYPFNLEDIITKTLELVKPRVLEKNIRLTARIDKGIPAQLTGDPVRLTQILLNLVENAVKFTEKGSVSLSANAGEQTNEDVLVIFGIKDTGIGIPEEKLNMIFDTFTQADTLITRKYGGSGLGLTIVKRLLEMQGGAITVTSREKEGTEFTVKMKFKKAGANQPILKGNIPKKNTGISKMKILLVEDHKINQLVASKILSGEGFEVDLAENGKACIEKLRHGNYDLVLMDVQMPEMDGYETTQFIRTRMEPPLNDIPIIAMTAYATSGEKGKCLRAGMNDYISKPFHPEDLFALILKYSGNGSGIQAKKARQEADRNRLNGKITDLTYLEELSAGSSGFVSEMIRMFLEQFPLNLESMEKAISDKDWKELYTIAHRMKPSISFVGIKDMDEVIEQIENYAGSGSHPEKIPQLFDALKKACYEAAKELEGELEKPEYKNSSRQD